MHTTSLSGTITTAIPREIFHWGAVAGVCVYVRVWLRFNWFGCLLPGLSLEASAGWGRIEVKTTGAHTHSSIRQTKLWGNCLRLSCCDLLPSNYFSRTCDPSPASSFLKTACSQQSCAQSDRAGFAPVGVRVEVFRRCLSVLLLSQCVQLRPLRHTIVTLNRGLTNCSLHSNSLLRLHRFRKQKRPNFLLQRLLENTALSLRLGLKEVGCLFSVDWQLVGDSFKYFPRYRKGPECTIAPHSCRAQRLFMNVSTLGPCSWFGDPSLALSACLHTITSGVGGQGVSMCLLMPPEHSHDSKWLVVVFLIIIRDTDIFFPSVRVCFAVCVAAFFYTFVKAKHL